MSDSGNAAGQYSAPAGSQAKYTGHGKASARAATKTFAEGSTDKHKVSVDDKDEQAGTNTDVDDLDHVDPLDKGATQEPDTGKWTKEEDEGQDTGPTPEMRFPLLDVEPNSITSLNTEDWQPNMIKRFKKPKIDYESLAYEAVVGSLAGHKKAFNSKSYGSLKPTVDISFHPKPGKRKVWKLDSESIQDSLAESPFGFRKTNESLANQFKSNMRTFVQPNSHYHGGPTMFKRGLNQYRNKAIRKRAEDPSENTVEPVVQNARDAFVLNDQVLYANTNVKLQFKTSYNQARVIPDSSNSGHIPEPTNWFTSSNLHSNLNSFGYPGIEGEKQFAYAPSLPLRDPIAGGGVGTGPYATHRTGGNMGYVAPSAAGSGMWNAPAYDTAV